MNRAIRQTEAAITAQTQPDIPRGDVLALRLGGLVYAAWNAESEDEE